MRIEKKCWPKFFQAILDNTKSFDVRLNDFECGPGDILVFMEWDPETREYTGRSIEKEVTSVVNTKDLKFWLDEDILEKGFKIIGLK